MISLPELRESYGSYYLGLNPGYSYVPYQQEKIIPALEAVAKGHLTRLMIFMPPGHLLEHDTPVRTPEGWKAHGDLQTGDFVYARDGSPTLVVGESPEDRADVRITMSDGSEFFVHENHRWTIFNRPIFQWETRSTAYFLKSTKFGRPPQLTSGGRGLYQLPLTGPVWACREDLKLHPYVLGAWLGDGSSAAPRITYPNQDSPIIHKIQSLGYAVSSTSVHKTTGVLTATFGGEHYYGGRLINELKALNLIKNKHIPECYKFASIGQRLELLAGLVDTDGHKDAGRGRFRIVTTIRRLADDIADVVRSLGWHPCISEGKLYNPPGATIISKKTPYYLGFSPNCELPVALERKRLTEMAIRRRSVYIAEVERVGGQRRGKCIQVAAPDGLYLIGKTYIPSHNSKTDLSTRNFIPWWLGRHPTKNAMVVSYAASLASDDFGGKIKERMESDLHKMIFPDSKIHRDSHGKNQFRTIKGGTFYSLGFGGAMAGKRVDLMVLDDLIKNDKEADSQVTQDALFATYGSVVKSRMKPNGAIIFCIHRWRPLDIAGRVLKEEGTVEQGGDWTVIRLPAEDPPDSENYLWESHYGKKHYEEAKRFEESWQAMWQQDPAGSKSLWFKPDWLEFYDVPPSAHKFNNYMIVDPSLGKKTKGSDRMSLHVWSAGQNEKLILSDWVLDKLDPGERAEVVVNKLRRWQPQQFLYEELGMMSDTYFIRKIIKEKNLNVRFYPIAVGRHGPRHLLRKSDRIHGLGPWFADHKIVLPRKFMYENSEGQRIDLTKRFIEEEYSKYKGEGSVQHDDDLDNMSRLQEPELVIRYYEREEQEVEKSGPRIQQGLTWQSRY